MKKTSRQIQRENQKKKQRRDKILLYGGIGLAVVAVIAVIVFLATKAPSSGGLMGDEVAVPSRDHVSSDTVPGPYNTNPPAGGAHFDTDWMAKFYQESELAGLPAHPEGYLVHSLEHGYVIFWYNCQVPNTDCPALKQSIQKVMDETGGTKLIAFPWSSMDNSLVMTSWGRILRFTTPDTAVMKQFVEHNRGQAPEPDAP
jgi:hypothetical protein